MQVKWWAPTLGTHPIIYLWWDPEFGHFLCTKSRTEFGRAGPPNSQIINHMYATQQHRVPPLCGPTLVHWLKFWGIHIPPKSPRIKHMFATTKGIGSLVPTTIVHWLNFGGIVCFSFLTRTLDAYFLVPTRTMPTQKKSPFHDIRIYLLHSRTLHISQVINLTPNTFQLSSLQTRYTSLMTTFFQSSNTLLPWWLWHYIYIYVNAEIF